MDDLVAPRPQEIYRVHMMALHFSTERSTQFHLRVKPLQSRAQPRACTSGVRWPRFVRCHTLRTEARCGTIAGSGTPPHRWHGPVVGVVSVDYRGRHAITPDIAPRRAGRADSANDRSLRARARCRVLYKECSKLLLLLIQREATLYMLPLVERECL